jgi:hypothetical protein
MEDETPFRIPKGKKLVCWLLDEETAAKLTGPLVVAAPDLLAECEMASDAIASGFNSEDERMAVVARLEAAIAKAKGDAMTAEQRAALYNNGIGVPYKERP